MPDEPQEGAVGVEAEQVTAPVEPSAETTAGVTTTAPAPTAEPKPQPVNLDDLPEFRKYKSEEQRRAAEQQRQLAEWQRQAREAQEAARVAAYNAEVAGKDDYEKQVIANQYMAQDVQRMQQQLQQQQALAQQNYLAEQNKRQFITEQESKAKKLGIEFTPQIREEILNAASPTDAAAAVAGFFIEQGAKRLEQAKVDQRKRDGTDNVDVGAGASTSPDTEWKRVKEQHIQANDLGGLIGEQLRRAAQGTR